MYTYSGCIFYIFLLSDKGIMLPNLKRYSLIEENNEYFSKACRYNGVFCLPSAYREINASGKYLHAGLLQMFRYLYRIFCKHYFIIFNAQKTPVRHASALYYYNIVFFCRFHFHRRASFLYWYL
jgi:hypothetical protein